MKNFLSLKILVIFSRDLISQLKPRNKIIKYSIVILLTLVFSSIITVNLNAQLPSVTCNTYKLPQETKGIFPIGWSSEGLFAYGIIDHDCGSYGACTVTSIIVVNTVTDKIYWHHTVSSVHREDKKYYRTFKKFWKGEHNKFNSKLNSFGIRPLPAGHKLEETSTLPKKYGITLKQPGWPADGIHKTFNYDNTIYAYNSKGKKKKIHSKNMGFPVTIKMIGYFKSPHEPRIAIWAYSTIEGGPSSGESHSYFIGCHLKYGYK